MPKYEKIQRISVETETHSSTSTTVDGSSCSDDDNTISHPPRSWWRTHWRIICETIALTAGITAVWLISWAPRMSLLDERNPSDGLTFTGGQLTVVQHLSRRPCGNSPEAAVARGCDFDHVTTRWLPPRCIDYELQEDFLTSIKPGGWRFWAEDGQEREHEADKIGFVRDEIWATNEWHM